MAGDAGEAAGQADVSPADFLVVGVGSSAGGLEPLSQLLKPLPADANLALVVVQHLDPNHESMLVELLQRVSRLPVQWAADGMTLAPGNVYVVAPHARVGIEGQVLKVRAPDGDTRASVIDHFFRALAAAFAERAVGVVLSGNGADGTHGAQALKRAGGVVFAQEPRSAGFPAMPRNAIAAGQVDRVLTPGEMAEALIKLTRHGAVAWARAAGSPDAASAELDADGLRTIFRLVAARTGVDFGDYKPSTIKRRLLRRMLLANAPELRDYVKLLQRDREEVTSLYESLLINVTSFFRDPEYFAFLAERVIPELAARAREAPLRVWVPGCSTGEEAYSLGILVRECQERTGEVRPVQIFGTDVSDHAIAQARAGTYAPADVAGVSAERLARYFHKTERGYTLQKPIRDLCIFARQNVAKDSPFSRIDLISCRNLLIYFGAKLQKKVMPIFHYALNPGGYLVLGNSESVGAQADLFRLVDRRYRIYSRKPSGRRLRFEFPMDLRTPVQETPLRQTPAAMPDELKAPFDAIREADRIVLQRHGPNGVLVNDELEILQFRGDVSPYLALAPGPASLKLLKLAREGLASELECAIDESRRSGARVRRSAIAVMQQGTARRVDIDVTPIESAHARERCYLVLFTPTDSRGAAGAPPAGKRARGKASSERSQIEQLRQDLQATRSYLQATIEKHEATNQELRAANEEIQSSNEELQSTNEELETAKEELQSTNEELTTVNEELHSRQLELIQLNNDLTNLINSVHLPIVILGQDLRIRRFTPMAERVLNVIPTDIGRPFSDININLDIPHLPALIAEVIETLTVKEIEVQDGASKWYSLRLRPYKTAENRIDGVVLTFIDIDAMKRTISALEEARDFARAVILTAPEPLAALDSNLRIESANDAFAGLLRLPRERLVGRSVDEILGNAGGTENLRSAIKGILPSGARLTDCEVELDIPSVGRARLAVGAKRIASPTREYPMILLSLRVLP